MTDPYEHIAARLGARLLRRWPLKGGVSAVVEALELQHPDGRLERVVVRRHGAIDKGHAPDVAQHELDVLSALQSLGMPVPAPLFVDDAAFPTPCLVMAFVEGTTEVEAVPDVLEQMAAFLADLHRLDPDALGVRGLPVREGPDRLLAEYVADPVPPARGGNRKALLHGDFWPGNILWAEGRIAAVLDWEDAAVGDPLSDLAGCRIELRWKYGEDAMKAFTTHYLARAAVDTADLPLWEMYVGSAAAAHMGAWGLDPERERHMRAATLAFVERARRSL